MRGGRTTPVLQNAVAYLADRQRRGGHFRGLRARKGKEKDPRLQQDHILWRASCQRWPAVLLGSVVLDNANKQA